MTTFKFGNMTCSMSEVFYETRLSYGIMNIKPVVPYHVLVIPKRVTNRVSDLDYDELCDLMTSAQEIGSVLEKYTNSTAITYIIHDGKDAGQTVPHVHIHIIPRKHGDCAIAEQLTAEEITSRAEELSQLF